jgi:predicted metal-dependent hydrolase
VRLTVTARDGLVVVVPARWTGDPAAIVASKHAWATRALASVSERRELLAAGAEALLPHEIELRAPARTLAVEYRHRGAGVAATARRHGDELVVTGDIDDADACLRALRRWLAREAKLWLPPRCEALAARCALLPSAVRVSAARTRWGSCSSRGTVSLNRTLLFLPPHLVDALVLHELAHLRVMDHSPRFWSLLASLDPDALDHRRQMRDAAERFVPLWAGT